MIYFSKEQLIIRNMEYKDAQTITTAEIEQGWNASIEKYLKRLEDQRSGKAISLVAEFFSQPAGYINVYHNSPWGAFGKKNYPEIVDFGVQCHGLNNCAIKCSTSCSCSRLFSR